ncbi:hypothetical protein AUO94_00460 [Planococcus kocurii]|uniref:Uncharacterized protein n=1 Tax=Planococcus kocurii TaxID=1374 RepID=A0ABN4JSJ7_9BACL|nr:hypothetical protein [Planococcus kocurii]ALS77205.1 hypothetical protein AUO94_00460 [Planococcus kocurii]
MKKYLKANTELLKAVTTGKWRKRETAITTSLKTEQSRMQDFLANEMVEGIDYGHFQNYSKAVLLKPGAEKLCNAYGLSKLAEVIQRTENWELGVFSYEVKVVLIDKKSGIVEAEGIGSCNSKEGLFKEIDVYNAVNMILKTAKKRALVDAVLSALGATHLFALDLVSLPNTSEIEVALDPATERQLKAIFRIVREIGLSAELAKGLMQEKYRVNTSKDLSKVQASDFIQDLLHLRDAYKNSEQSLENQ